MLTRRFHLLKPCEIRTSRWIRKGKSQKSGLWMFPMRLLRILAQMVRRGIGFAAKTELRASGSESQGSDRSRCDQGQAPRKRIGSTNAKTLQAPLSARRPHARHETSQLLRKTLGTKAASITQIRTQGGKRADRSIVIWRRVPASALSPCIPWDFGRCGSPVESLVTGFHSPRHSVFPRHR